MVPVSARLAPPGYIWSSVQASAFGPRSCFQSRCCCAYLPFKAGTQILSFLDDCATHISVQPLAFLNAFVSLRPCCNYPLLWVQFPGPAPKSAVWDVSELVCGTVRWSTSVREPFPFPDFPFGPLEPGFPPLEYIWIAPGDCVNKKTVLDCESAPE